MSASPPSDESSPSLRVLHIGKYFPPFRGGMETYLRDLMRAMTDVQVISSALVHDHRRSFRSRASTLTTARSELTILRAARWINLSFAPISPGFPLLFLRMLRQEKPDILHFHLPNASTFWALIIPKARRLPWVVHWHSDVPETVFASHWWLRPLALPYRALERALLRRAARIIATSPPYLRSSPFLAAFRGKCRVIPLGLPSPAPTHTCAGNKTASRGPDEPLRLLAVGRLSYYKGFSVLLEALSQAPDVELQLVGDGERRDELQALASELSIDSRVRFRGSISDEELEAAWAWCDCLCLPSIERSEAFGIVLLEAMSRGKACIVSDIHGSGMGWVVEEGVTGLVVESRNAQALSEGLQALNSDRAALDRMGRAGQRKFQDQLDIARSARQVKTLYQDVTAHAG
ncbi:glycosyltransferase [Chromatocurvus halotolerans]|uniref:Rhamnosyl/mannosyltransferase n=1 Tax=Chromatocurvus halotolerans TaxID=1132028 RepID=A0A4R2K911_9GAMM|nr:glycosyltransferase [Chromatocurvus halotolerans]TCO69873.1 rhamnosyl/mannosyltransferase [Chromatocurvus halotolerans]